MVYLISYLAVLAFLGVQLLLPHNYKIPRVSHRPKDLRASTFDALQRSARTFQGTLRLRLSGRIPSRFKKLIIEATERGNDVRLVSSLNDEGFVNKLALLGAQIRLGPELDESTSFTGTFIFGDAETYKCLIDAENNVTGMTESSADVRAMREQFDQRFAFWTPFRGDGFSDTERAGLDSYDSYLEDNPAAKAKHDRALNRVRITAVAIVMFGGLSVVYTLVQFMRLGAAAWLIPVIIVTGVIGQLILSLHRRQLDFFTDQMMQLRSEANR